MEPIFQAHPIPQNVTNFEFHLVGDMTLKQFGYLAAGLGLAFLVFTTLSSAQPIIAWPIIVISALLGVAFAFLPIQERPLDHWVSAFFKAIFKPTSLKFSSKVISPEDPLFTKRLPRYIKTYKYTEAKKHAPLGNPNLFALSTAPMPASATTAQAKTLPQASGQKKQNFIDKFKAGQTSFAAPLPNTTPTTPAPAAQPKAPAPSAPQTTVLPQVTPVQQMPPAPKAPPSPVVYQQTATPGILRNPAAVSKLPDLNISRPAPAPTVSPQPQAPAIPVVETSPKDLKKTVELAKEAQETQQQILKIETALNQIKQQAAQPGVDPKSYLENFEDLLNELQKLNDKASETAKKMAELSPNSAAQPQTPQPAQPVPETPIKAKSIPTLKLTSFPNVVNGIVTDSQGNYIEGAIVVAHDKQGLPVRALKSNKLGQFVAATPLPNGEYSIVVEKENLNFDKVAIELKNEVLEPILMQAKKVQVAT